MAITVQKFEDRDLAIFTAVGELTFSDQMEALRSFYEGSPTLNVIWDLRNISGHRITADELRRIIAYIHQYQDKRPGGKTALVSATPLDFGMSRMSEFYAKSEGLPWTLRAFQSMEDAETWIVTDGAA